MYKIKYCIVCLCFLFACKNDPKTSETATATNGEATATTTGTESSSPSTDVNGVSTASDGVVPAADNVITSSGTTTSTASGSTTSTVASAPQRAPGTSNNADAPKVVFGKSKVSETLTTIMADDKKYGKGASNLPIPDPCTLISESSLNTLFGLKNSPEIKSGSKTPRPAEKSCFFKFGDSNKPNAGIMLQIMTNPYPDEIEDYPSLVVDGKIKDGEQSPYDKTPKRFKPWNEMGDSGCYSYEAGKYHWKIGSKYLFLLAFNTNHTEAQQMQLASTIGKEVMKNFASKLK
jgi:hypothetical protein